MPSPENLQSLRRTVIYFGKKDEENGFYQLLVSGMPAVALENGRYVVNAKQLEILQSNKIEYHIADTSRWPKNVPIK